MEITQTSYDERKKSVTFLAIAAIMWSTGGILIKLIKWNPVAISGGRSLLAFVTLMIIAKRPHIKITKVKLGAAFAYAGTVLCFVVANKLTTSANAILLQYTAPIYVAVLSSWLLKEKIKKSDCTVIFFVFLGMILFFIGNIKLDKLLGNFIAMLSGVLFALQILLLRKQKDGSPVESVILGNLISGVISIPFMFQSAPNGVGIVSLLFLGVVQLGISYAFYSEGIKHISAIEGALIPILEPILNPVWVFIFVGEAPTGFELLGGFIVIVSVTLRCVLPFVRARNVEKQ